MILRYVRGENFMSFVEFMLDLYQRGLCVITGENDKLGDGNGAGKSALFDALCWCLWGELADQQKSLRPTEVARDQKGNCLVECVIETEQGAFVGVRRYLDHKTYGRKLLLFTGVSVEKLWEPANEKTLGGNKETQALISEMIGMTFATFMSIAVFPQGGKGFASKDSSEMDEVLTAILRTRRFDTAGAHAKATYDSVYKRIQTLDIEKAEAEKLLGQAKGHVAALVQKQSEWSEKQVGRLRDAGEEIKRIRNLQPASHEGYAAQRLTIQLQVEAIENSGIADIRDQANLKLAQIHEAARKIQREQGSINYEVQTAQSEIVEDIGRYVQQNTNCKLCGQPTSSDQAKGELASRLLAGNEERKKKITDLQAKWAELQRQYDQLMQQENAASSVIVRCGEALDRAAPMRTEIHDIDMIVMRQQHAEHTWKVQLDAAMKTYDTVEAETDPFAGLIEPARAALVQHEGRIAAVEKSRLPLVEDFKHLSFLERMFAPEGVKAFLVESCIPYLEARANYYMGILTRSSGRVIFSTEKSLKGGTKKDKFNVQVIYDGGCSILGGTSGGEHRRADFAILFALGDLAAARSPQPISIRLLDEPFDGLGAAGKEAVTNVLRDEILGKVGTILVMTHDEQQKDLFENRIHVAKTGGVSRMVAA